ncbi:MAG: EAL domain-containing protein [Lachnospiraceae bacterium]
MQGNFEKVVGFDELLKGLSENYGAIYYVDFEKDIIEAYRMNEVIENLLGDYLRTGPSYEDAMDRYIQTVVSEKDKEELTRVTRYEFLKEQLMDVRAFSHEYRLERNGREYVFRFKIANLDGIGELKHAVIGFADVSAEKARDYNYYQSGRKILIVEDSNLGRELLKDILSTKYEVVTATNGEEALTILGTSYDEIALVMTDLCMPVMDGYELIKKMKAVRQYSNIPIIVLTGTSDFSKKDTIEVKCLELGASDFVLKPYNGDVILNRVNSLIHLRESTTFLHYLEKDSLTGVYTKEFFYQRVEQQIQKNPEEEYIMFVTDIIGLKVINENYGIEVGDEILKILANFRHKLEYYLFCGRIEGDKFAGLIKAENFDAFLTNLKEKRVNLKFPIQNVVIKHGYYRVRKHSNLQPQGMYDRGLLAISKIKDVYGVYLAEYDDELRKDLLLQRRIAESAEDALINNQFVIYYQPKFNVQQEKVNGAEALIRWLHPEIGFMNPAEFIPIFERNGFIKKLDYFVWKEVCRNLQNWKNRGLELVPISVNVSRRDFEDPLLAESVIAIADHYQVDHSLLHVEITESSYSENPQRIAETIHKFHAAGIVVELDDFGSGYSSMIALNELDIDVLKLDMSIIQRDNPESSRSILGFSMQLAQMMKLKTVSEGVETKEQAERIASLGGDYIQGYYYSKPLPKEEFEKFMI